MQELVEKNKVGLSYQTLFLHGRQEDDKAKVTVHVPSHIAPHGTLLLPVLLDTIYHNCLYYCFGRTVM